MRYRNLLSVMAGSVFPFLTGLILVPIVKIILNKYLYVFGPKNSTHDLIVSLTMISWVFIASVSGGLSGTLIARKNEWLYTLFSMTIVFTALILMSGGAIFENITTDSLLAVLMIPLGFLVGIIIGNSIKRRKRKKIEMLISSIPSSHTDTAEQ